jgi:hypothetical protein
VQKVKENNAIAETEIEKKIKQAQRKPEER